LVWNRATFDVEEAGKVTPAHRRCRSKATHKPPCGRPDRRAAPRRQDNDGGEAFTYGNSTDAHEADILVEYGAGRVFALEVEATSAPKRDGARHLMWLRDELGNRFLGGALLHTGPRAFELDTKIVAAPIAALWA